MSRLYARHACNKQCRVIEARFVRSDRLAWLRSANDTTRYPRASSPFPSYLISCDTVAWWFIARYAFFDTCLEATGFQKDPGRSCISRCLRGGREGEGEREVDELRRGALEWTQNNPTAVPFILNSIHAIEFYISFPPSDERLSNGLRFYEPRSLIYDEWD